ncbi:tetratricopeptide repeat protein [Chloracidobacterium sp. MS 40/45]|uniref:tetratricopeptide repeat protein n=1 Tax=Chloracidobacterium aggregatum TaxID=2851959 RepID=UPI001B8AF407|nr:tetratricopeptide repeat protein [Chloracidobacterium aggregatum]QUV99190.1 tetratricopeptide repeat protein [Chloracidobacterium sp. MS 40/45]
MDGSRSTQPVRQRFFLFLFVILAAGLVVMPVAWWMVGAQNRPRPKSPAGTPTAKPSQPSAPPATDATRATPAELRDALYATETFLGVPTLVPRPFAEAEAAITALQSRYPADVRLLRYGAFLNERLGNIPRALQLMTRYANLRPESTDGVRRLAAFYHGRGLYTEEVRTLQRLALLTPSAAERRAVADRVSGLVQKRALTGVDVADWYRQLIGQRPEDITFLKRYLERLVADDKADEALRALDMWQPKYPDEMRFFLELRARLYDKRGQRDAAVAVYDQAFDPLWPRPIVRDWYERLRQYGRYRTYRRQLQERFRQGASDFGTAARLFNVLAYEGNLAAAVQTLTSLEKRREKTGWPREELDRAAAMCLNIGQYDLAARFLYSLYAMGGASPGSPEREATLAKLVAALLDANEVGTTLSAGDLSLYADIAQVDQGAGFLNGVLSLILAGNNIPREYAQANRSATAYFNRALAYRFFTALQSEYPRSGRLLPLHARLLEAFAAMGEHETVVRLGEDFLRAFPDAPTFPDVTLRVAEAEARLGRRDAERKRLIALLDWLAARKPDRAPLMPVSTRRWVFVPTDMPGLEEDASRPGYRIHDLTDTDDSDGDAEDFQDYDYQTDYLGRSVDPPETITYASVLERVIASFATGDQNHTDEPLPGRKPRLNPTLTFLYGEIKKHPREEGLYERLLRWLGQQSLVDEQLRAYQEAVRRFGDNTWRHRLARWFIRNDRQTAFAQYSKQLSAALDDEDLSAYLQAFFEDVQLEEGNNDARLYLQLFRMAHDRFPTNLFFVRGLLNYYRATNRLAEWERLATQYYFADPTLRSAYLAYLSEKKRLAASYAKSKAQNDVSHRQFAADAALWLSRHEEAVEAYRELVTRYPGDIYYAGRLATLLRSLAATRPGARDEAAQQWAALARVYPAENRFLTLAGEVRAEAGDWEGAAAHWENIARRAPGDPEAYLELATLYWDYYRYDDAIRTLQTLRQRVGDDTLYAYQLGALYEERQQRERALAEYMAAVGGGAEREPAIERLVVLSRRKDGAAAIEAAFQARLAKQNTPELILGYADYLKRAERRDAALDMLAREAARKPEIPFLEAVRDEFRAAGRVADERKVLERLVAMARDERENIKYRLQLATFFEAHNQRGEALQTLDGLARDYRNNLGVVQEVGRFYGRLGAVDKAVTLAQASRQIATGDYRRNLTLQLARRQRESGQVAAAETTLREWYAANPTDTEAFTELARLLGDTRRDDDLAALYRQGLANLAAGADEFELRKGYIGVLTRLGRHQEAVDQHIELINREPEDSSRLQVALRYAEQQNLLERMTRYYTDLAAKADRNYRWNVVLGEIYRFQGNLGGAAEQYAKAIVNEPQRGDFRSALAALYRQAGRYDEALATLKRAAELEPQNPRWAAATAEVYLEQGQTERAVAALRESFARRKQLSAQVYFAAGRTLLAAGAIAEGGSFYDEGFSRVMKSPTTETFDEDAVVAWLQTILYRESAVASLGRLETLEAALAKAPQNEVVQRARGLLDYTVRPSRFPQVIRSYATAAQLAQLDEALTQRLTRAGAGSAEFQRLASIAVNLHLYRATEQALLRRKDATYAAQPSAEDPNYVNALRALLSFHESRLDTKAALALLTAEEARARFPGAFDFTAAKADFCRNVGDVAAERTVLEQYYQQRTGALVTEENPLVMRLLELLHQQGDRQTLRKLAASYSPYQLQLINFLVYVREKELARLAIEQAGQPVAWQQARLAQLELYFRNRSPEVETLYRQVLGIRPIGEQANRKPDPARELTGEDWFRTARNYGVWLTLDDARAADALRFLVAETEASPRSATAQTTLAYFLCARKRYPEALEHARLARELAPEDPEAMAAEGAALYEMGNRTAALGTWRRMLAGRRNQLAAHLTFLSVLTQYDLLNEALPPVEAYLVARLRERADEDAYEPLVTLLCTLARSQAGREALIAPALVQVLAATPDDIRLGLQLTLTEALPERTRLPLYRLTSERLANQIITAYARGDYDLYSDDVPGSDTLAGALSKVQRAWATALVASKAYAEAERELRDMVTLRQTLFGRMREEAPPDLYISEPETVAVEPEWLVMAQAAVAIRSGRTAAAVERLKAFVAAPAAATPDAPNDTGAIQRAQHACYLLLNEGKAGEATAFLETCYQLQIARDDSLGVALGYIEAQLMRRQTEVALRQLTRLVERRPEPQVLAEAAALAARYGAYAPALKWRERLYRLLPGDAENRIEMARLLARTGDLGAAATQLYELAHDRRLPMDGRQRGLQQLAALVLQQPAVGEALLGKARASSDAESLTCLAALQDALGRTTEAQKTFEQAAQMPYATGAREAYGQFLERTNRPGQAVPAYVQALREGSSSDREQVIRAALAANQTGLALALARNVQFAQNRSTSLPAAGVVYEQPVVPWPAAAYTSASRETAELRLAAQRQLLSRLVAAALAQQDEELAMSFAEALLALSSSSPAATDEARQLLAEVRRRLEQQPARKNLFGLTPTSELNFTDVVGEGL